MLAGITKFSRHATTSPENAPFIYNAAPWTDTRADSTPWMMQLAKKDMAAIFFCFHIDPLKICFRVARARPPMDKDHEHWGLLSWHDHNKYRHK